MPKRHAPAFYHPVCGSGGGRAVCLFRGEIAALAGGNDTAHLCHRQRFLVLGPIQDHAYGSFGPRVMAALCLVAYLFRAAIRANIARVARKTERDPLEMRPESRSSWAGASAMSVACYPNLFGSFGVSLTTVDTQTDPQARNWPVFRACGSVWVSLSRKTR